MGNCWVALFPEACKSLVSRGKKKLYRAPTISNLLKDLKHYLINLVRKYSSGKPKAPRHWTQEGGY